MMWFTLSEEVLHFVMVKMSSTRIRRIAIRTEISLTVVGTRNQKMRSSNMATVSKASAKVVIGESMV